MTTFPSQTVRLKSGSAPQLNVTFGQAHIGLFSIAVWNPGANHWDPLFVKPNVNAPDTYQFPSVASCIGKVIKIAAYEQSAATGAGVHFSVTVQILQDGTVADGGDFPPSSDKDSIYQAYFKQA
jgi:hypothetical protein